MRGEEGEGTAARARGLRLPRTRWPVREQQPALGAAGGDLCAGRGGAGPARSLLTPPPPRRAGRGVAERPGGRAGTEPGSRRRHHGHPAAGRQDRGSVARRPPLVLCAQPRLGALAVREGRGQEGPGRPRGRGNGGPGRRWREARMRGRRAWLPRALSPCAAPAGRERARPELSPAMQPEGPFPRAWQLCVDGGGGAPRTFWA